MPNTTTQGEYIQVARATWDTNLNAVAQHRSPAMPTSVTGAIRSCEKCAAPINQDGPMSTFNGTCTGCKATRCRLCCTCYQCTGCTERARSASGSGRNSVVTHRRETHERCSMCRSCVTIPGRDYVGTCSCRSCAGCSTRRAGSTFCREPNCNRSRDCCGCACTRGWAFVNRAKPTFHSHTFKRLRSRRFLSLEIETAHLNAGKSFMQVIEKWQCAVVADGSIGDGFEINTSPAAGDDFISLISELAGAMAKQGATVDGRCGLHCHIDARDYNFYETKRMGLLWQRVEPALYRLVHPKRHESTFCVPCGAKYGPILEQGKLPKQAKDQYFLATYNRAPSKELNRSTLRGQKYGGNRYNSLNMHSWMFRGTFENRMHHGTVNEMKLIMWGVLNAHLVDWAYNHSEADLYRMWRPTPAHLQPGAEESASILWQVLDDQKLREYWQGRHSELKRYHENPARDIPVDP